MAYNSGATITCYVHGDKSPYSHVHHSPNIYLKFTTTITRSGTSVTVKLSNMTFKALGGYGYPLTVYAKVNGGSWNKIDKSTATTAVKWTRSPSAKSFTVTNFTGSTISVAIGAHSTDAKKCYGSGTKTIATYSFNVPVANYTLTYSANGGTNAPASVTVTPNTQVNIATEIPFATTVLDYYKYDPNNVIDHSVTIEREFDRWYTAMDGSGTDYYPTGSSQTPTSITVTADTTLYAQWKPIAYVVEPYVDPLGVTLKFYPNGGTVNPVTHLVSYRQIGYSLMPGGSPYLVPGQTYNIPVSRTPRPMHPTYQDHPSAIVKDTDLPPALEGSTIFRDGYAFTGWYLDEELETPIEVPYSTRAQTLKLYADWKSTPLYTKTGNVWVADDINTVWKCVVNAETGQKEWQRIAHIYQCTKDSQDTKYWRDRSI